MEPNPSSRRLLFAFPHPARGEESKISSGEMPRERLYGAMELQERGWHVDYADARYVGPSASLHRWVRGIGINSVDLGSLARLRRYDCIVVKDSFSTMTSVAARLSGVPMVYLDAMFDLPRNARHRAIARTNISLADRIICYSRFQAKRWAHELGLPVSRFSCLPYCIDLDFYRSGRCGAPVERMVLAIGRDLGRDFLTLARALRDADIRLKVVTLPYLVPDEIRAQPNVEIFEHIPYAELFELYARAACVVVPLKEDITYPSGIRAVMESLVLGKATICTESPVLREYFSETDGVRYVTPQDIDQMRHEIFRVLGDADERQRHEQSSLVAVARYGLSVFVDEFEDLLDALVKCN